MKIESTNRDSFLEGIQQLTGISLEQLENYSQKNDILHIWNHPEDLKITNEQLEIINKLKKFHYALEFLKNYEDEKKQVFNEPDKIAAYFRSQMFLHKEKEYFMVAYLDSKGHLLTSDIWEGGINQISIEPRSILKRALQIDSAAIIIGHCHPSGDPSPSKSDIDVTKKIQRIFESLGMAVHDHIIIGDNDYVSLREMDYMGEQKGYVQKSDFNEVSMKEICLPEENMEEYERE